MSSVFGGGGRTVRREKPPTDGIPPAFRPDQVSRELTAIALPPRQDRYAPRPATRRQFLVAAGGLAAASPAATETPPADGTPCPVASPRSARPLAPEPPPPAGVCRRLGSARFRELGGDYRFSADSRWLAEFHSNRFVAYEVRSGRRVSWTVPDIDPWEYPVLFSLTTAGRVVAVWPGERVNQVRWFVAETGREQGRLKLPAGTPHTPTSDGTGLITYDDKRGILLRNDLATGRAVWSREWKTDATAPTAVLEATVRWLVGTGVKRLHLLDPATGTDGPKLEDAPPKDAPAGHHFAPVNFSADGKRVCGWFTDPFLHRAVVWDVDTGKVVGRITPPSREPVCLTADGGHLLAVIRREGNRLALLDVATGKVVRRLETKHVGYLHLSPDGKVLAAERTALVPGPGGFGGSGLGVVIPEKPKEPAEETIGGPVLLLDSTTGRVLPQSPDPPAHVSTVRFIDRNTVVATLGIDWVTTEEVVWDARTGARRVVPNPVSPNRRLERAGGSAVLSPDARHHLVRVDRQVWVTDAVTRVPVHRVALPTAAGVSDTFWIDRHTVGVLDDQILYVCGVGAGTRRTIPLRFGKNFIGLDHPTPSADGRTLAFCYPSEVEDNIVRTHSVGWIDLLTGKVTTAPTAIYPQALAVSADGNRVAVTGGAHPDEALGGKWSTRVFVFERSGRRFEFAPPSESEGVGARVELSACGRMAFLIHSKPDKVHEFITGPPVLQFWEVLTGQLRAEFTLTDRTITLEMTSARQLAVSPCGRRLVSCHPEAPVFLWDVFGETAAPQPKPDAKKLAAAWDDLLGRAATAFAAIRLLVQHPASAVELLSANLTPAEAPKPGWVKARIEHLGSRDFRTRHAAELKLSAVADVIADELRIALDAGGDTQETYERLERLVARAAGLPGSAIRTVRAVEVLEHCGGKGAGELLTRLAGGADAARLTREARGAIRRRAWRG